MAKEWESVLLRLEPSMLKAIDERRADTGLNRSEAMRKMLSWALATKRELEGGEGEG